MLVLNPLLDFEPFVECCIVGIQTVVWILKLLLNICCGFLSNGLLDFQSVGKCVVGF